MSKEYFNEDVISGFGLSNSSIRRCSMTSPTVMRKHYEDLLKMLSKNDCVSTPTQTKSVNSSTTLSNEQIKQITKSGSFQAIKGILNNSSLMISDDNRKILTNRLNEYKLSQSDTIKIRTAASKYRTNQTNFRKAVISQYNGMCVVTGIHIDAILDAAHVVPANGNNDRLDNSLLLCKNIHGLFDRCLISINPESNRLELSDKILGCGFDEYNGKHITHCVSKENLRWHYDLYINRR